jgi:Carbohydrate family 9 binding domain-like
MKYMKISAMKTTITVATLLIAVIAHAKNKEYTASFMRTVPKIDGNITNDAAWRQLTWKNDFRKFRQCTPARRKTRFKVGYAYDGLYIAIECDEPEMNKISIARKDMEELWHDDNIEVFVASGKLKYRHFVVNAAGARGNEMMNKSKVSGNSFLWKWQARVKRNSKSWTAEIMIPYYLLEFFPSSKLKVGFNIGRTATSINEISSWASQKISFHDVGYFGTLRFSGKLSKQELNKLIQARALQNAIAGSVVLKRKWNKFKQNFTKGNDDYYKLFTDSHKAKINKLDKMIHALNHPTKEKYQASQKAFKLLEKEVIEFDRKLGRQLISELTNN